MKVKYIGDPIERARADATGSGITVTKVTSYGRDFTLGEATDVSDMPEAVKQKYRGHTHFEVVPDLLTAPVAPTAAPRALRVPKTPDPLEARGLDDL